MGLPRPLLHHAPESGWVNDPLALTRHGDRFHLFFQYLPDRTDWSVDCRWGHASSADLLTWRTEPVALEPGDGEDGVWSGSLAVPPSGPAVVFYTAVSAADRELGWVRRALAADESWHAWQKAEVVVPVPSGDEVTAFRDPFVQRYGEGWRMLLGGALASGDGAVWVSLSPDLVTWSAPVVAASGPEVGPLWECPALLRVGDRDVLVVSAGGPGEPHSVTYAWCTDGGERLDLGPWQRLTHGPSLYAASGFTEDDGQPGLICWLRHVGDVEAGWMGAHSLPYRLAADGDRLVASPHPALLDRRTGGPVLEGLLPTVADLDWTPHAGDVLAADGRFVLAAVGESLVVTVEDERHDLPWGGGPVRVVLDGPVLEVFGGRGVLAVRVPATGLDGVLSGDLERVAVHRLG